MEPLHPVTEAALRDEVARVLAFFYENYGLEPVDLSVTTVRELSTGANASVGQINIGRQLYNTAEPDFPIAHEYFHVLQFHWGDLSSPLLDTPNWLIEGTAVYADDVYERERLGMTGDGIRAQWWRRTTGRGGNSLPLDHWVYDHGRRGNEAVHEGYYVGALATDWLVRRAAALSTGTPFAPLEPPEMVARPDHDAHFEFFRLLPESASWEEAFAAAFGIAGDDFYEAFAEYRIALGAQYLPHLADDRDEPLLVFLGEIPPDTRIRIREQFETAQGFFRERFGSVPVDYTVVVAADDGSAKAMHAQVFGTWDNIVSGIVIDGICKTDRIGVALFLTLANCPTDPLADSLGGYHFDEVLDRVAPSVWVTRWLPGSLPPGPHWLHLATRGYAAAAYRDAVGIETLDEARQAGSQLARRMAEPLSSLTTLPEPGAFPDEAAEALSFLAGDWLVARAGEAAIFEYYRLLESADSWEDAFEAAFRIGVEEFYAVFAASRGRLPVPRTARPDEEDGRHEPNLVLLGAVSAEIAQHYRRQIRALQDLFRDRFGTELADYTLYLAADEELAAPTYVRLLGRDRPDSLCGQGDDGRVLFMIEGCAVYPDPVTRLHHDATVLRLVPWESSSPARPGVWGRGPAWLQSATASYADHAYLASRRTETFARLRRQLALLAGETSIPLREMEGAIPPQVPRRVGWALSFLAADWLAQRAGEPALFEYYRLLGSTDSWQQAFAAAFGIGVEEFYEEFAEYRVAPGAVAQPDAPDEPARPQLVLLGEFDSWSAVAVPARFEAVQAFFGDRLGGEPVDYTVYVAATPRAAAAHRDVIGDRIGTGCWSLLREGDWDGPLLIVLSACVGETAETLGWFHYLSVLRQLMPPGAWERSPSEYKLQGCYWLDLGLYEYADRAFLDSLGRQDLDRLRRGLADFASRAEGTLSDFEPHPSLSSWSLSVPDREAKALSFLAADWLVARAGERAIFEYYRLRQSAADWRDAFEGAFGITVDDFYAAFSEYRAGL